MAQTRQCSSCSMLLQEDNYVPEEWDKEDGERNCQQCQIAISNKEKLDEIRGKAADPERTHHRLYADYDGFYKFAIFVGSHPHLLGQSLISTRDEAGQWKAAIPVPNDQVFAFDVDVVGEKHDLDEFQGNPLGGDDVMQTFIASQQENARATKQLANEIKEAATSKDSYTKLMFQSKILGEFTVKYPKDQQSFYLWLFSIREFETKHAGLDCAPSILFEKVLKSLNSQERSSWDLYRETTWHNHLAANADAEDTVENRAKWFEEEVDTMSRLIRYTIEGVKGDPDIDYFAERMRMIRCLRNENPKETLNRIETYLFQYDSLRTSLDGVDLGKLRKFNEYEIFSILRSVFIKNNTEGSSLNNRVRNKVASKWKELEKSKITAAHTSDEYAAFNKEMKKFIKTQLPQKVLPVLDEVNVDPDKTWKKHSSDTSLFTLRLNASASGTRRTGADNGSSKRSRSRYTGTQKPCPHGAECTFLNTARGCYLYHPVSELRAKKRRKLNPRSQPRKRSEVCRNHLAGRPCANNPCPYTHPSKRSSSNPNRKPSFQTRGRQFTGQRQQWKPLPCNNGTACNNWQNGRCRFQHNNAEMKCGFCGKPGHSRSRCFQQQKSGSKPPPHYTAGNTNHPGVQPHNVMMAQSHALVEKSMDAIKVVEDNINQRFDDLDRRLPLLNVARSSNSHSQRDKKKLVDLLGKFDLLS